jgi:hypothetical protein
MVACAAKSPNSAFVTDAVINRVSVVEWNLHFIDCFNSTDVHAERQFDIRAIPIPSLIRRRSLHGTVTRRSFH